jgi:pilus assembly protein FimV
MSPSAHAAGLGKIVVFSALGQPLRAEIEVSATREELADMKAQLASQDAFKQAGLDYATTLLGIRFSLDKRANGQSVIKLSSDRPINDPFVDLLLELNWPAGRLVREYTFLLDPPELAARGSAPVALAASVKPPATSKAPAVARAPAPIDDEVRSKAMAQARAQEAARRSAEQQSAGERGVREVRRGDTLRKIAGESKWEGVSLEQMLVGLLRANQEAFDGGNMNRLKAGKILSVPDKPAVETVSTADAKKIVIAQSADWNAYRRKLAGVAAQAPAPEDAAKQEVGGKITAKVEDKAAPETAARDQLRVSRTETTGTRSGAAAGRNEEDQVAKERALREASERLVALEKNVADLQKLVELKNQSLAELQKQAAAKAAPVEAKGPVEEAKPQTPAPAPVLAQAKVEPAAPAPEKSVEKPAEPKAAEPAIKPEEVKPEAKPEPKPEPAPKPAEAQKPRTVPSPPPQEPGFLGELFDNPLTLAGGGGILALIAAYFVLRRRRAADAGEAPLDLRSTLSPQSSSLAANSVFRSTGGQSVDTSHTPAQTDFSQAGPGSIDTDEVDPVAEADVYMAYGRDVQAEEILVEAKQKDPKRHAIHLKLLEIYSNRKDLKQFEKLATELHRETGGVGADWEKAVAMGLKLDPGNALFGASVPAAAAALAADATVTVPAQPMKSTVTLPGALSQLAAVASVGALPATADAPPAADLASLDFDLGLGVDEDLTAPGVAKETIDEAPRLPEPALDSGALDFDLAADSPGAPGSSFASADETVLGLDFNLLDISTATTAEAGGKDQAADHLDFDLGLGPTTATEAQPAAKIDSSDALDMAFVDDGGVEFDVGLTESTFLGQAAVDPSSFDLSSIDLDLNEPEVPASAVPPAADAGSSLDKADDTLDVLDSSFDSVQVSTAVNPDFATEQADTVVNPQFGAAEHEETIVVPQSPAEQEKTIVTPQFAVEHEETVVAPQFAVEQEETIVNPQFDVEPDETIVTPQFAVEPDRAPGEEFSTAQAETLVNPEFGAEQDLLPEFDISANEEVATKLDLAKAYEEMGDFEGARELLQEVLKEGDVAQRENAEALLAKLGN